ncbi:DNA topoisomerase [Handroanthus impetiginosus]|uniref:DNA topoisomerase n=1 Tax=Handroanthus impetiginosus TaxID=429701 RepID=A0A2G9HWI4_9LAMI|nr:DNA topoisomerase [Handroanthus impetiginosus]
METPFCYCRKVARLRTSWTDANPGRRFFNCSSTASGCDFFCWKDPPMCNRVLLVIPGLLRKLNQIENELSNMKKKVKILYFLLLISWLYILL